MLKINLYPGPPRRKLFSGRFPRVDISFPSGDRVVMALVAGAVLLVILGVVSWVVKQREIGRLNEEIQAAVADSTRYAGSIRLINDIREREEWIRERIGIIRRIDEHRYLWPRLMAGINDALPPVTWLTSIETLTPFPGLTFRIDGISFSNIEVADYMRRLSRIPDMREVRLITTREHEIEGIATMAFSLECRYGPEAGTEAPPGDSGGGRPARSR
jgi:Tfp pilus assembly protein PilN